jgi:catalase
MPASTSPSTNVAEQIVNAQRALAGPHPGCRPVHAKGIVCSATFTASAEARRVSRATHLQGEPTPAIIRFSNSSGDPEIHDGQPNARALAVKFELPGGKYADVLGLSIEGFAARTPEEFLAFLQAQLPDAATGKATPERVGQFIQSHPATQAFIGRLMQKPVPASYAQAGYHAQHAFRFSAADGTNRYGRCHFIPEAGESFLNPEEAAKRDRDFLRAELAGRLAQGHVVFRLTLQLAADGDPTNDPTVLWPSERPVVALGRLEISAISPTSAADERRLVFDPINLTEGIELSDDPFPRVRSAGYAVSYERRSKGE